MYEPNIDGLLLYYNFNRKGNVLILKFIITTCVRHKLYNYAMLLMPIKYNFNFLSSLSLHVTLLAIVTYQNIYLHTFLCQCLSLHGRVSLTNMTCGLFQRFLNGNTRFLILFNLA